jgi:carboxypeptidase T
MKEGMDMKTTIRIHIVSVFVLMALALPYSSSSASEPTGEWFVSEAIPDAVEAGPPEPYAYRDYATIRDILYDTEDDHPDIAQVHDIGDAWEKTQGLSDRDILAIKISDNVETDEDEPEALIMALHHAREWPTSEIAVQLIENLTDMYGSDARISWLVDNREIWIVPVVNPDGLDYALNVDENWRKNRRDNGDDSFGVDINRNYAGSMNGDPLGEWGGAGTSDDPSSITYCGEYPFSEPETQAIRDLALNHSFATAIDFHTYSDLVMWPWGYTTDLPPDNDDLVRIGTNMAALNGYTADQSVGLYPTTGDSLDWLYGGVDVYAFLFEVGGQADGYHPDEASVVLDQIAENIPPALLLIEVSGDREERQFEIDHEPLDDELYSGLDRVVAADITAARGVDASDVALVHRTDGGNWQEVAMVKQAGNDTYAASLPAQSTGSVVDYYIVARDMAGVEMMSPRYAPYELHSYDVLADTASPVADAGLDATVGLGWFVIMDGSGSADNVRIANLTWSFTYNGSAVELYGETPSFVFWTEGTYTVTLTVFDPTGNTDTDELILVVSSEAIPEFGSVLVPAVAMLLMSVVFLKMSRARRR